MTESMSPAGEVATETQLETTFAGLVVDVTEPSENLDK